MNEFRDAIAEVVADTYDAVIDAARANEGARPLDEAVADAILAMPEMQELRRWLYDEATGDGQHSRADASAWMAGGGLPESVIDWVMGETTMSSEKGVRPVSDIVERLRSVVIMNWEADEVEDPLCAEAADEIERLRDELVAEEDNDAGYVLARLGLDPDTVLDKDCEECLGRGWDLVRPIPGVAEDAVKCPSCGGSGRQVINRIVVAPADWDTTAKALRIGRAVLASEEIDDPHVGAWGDGWNAARAEFLAAGDDHREEQEQ